MASIKRRVVAAGPRYDVRWRLPDRSVRTKTFRRRVDADAFRRHVEAQELVGLVTDLRRGSTSVAERSADWLRSVPGKRATSLDRDRSILDRHVLPVLGARQVRSISRADVQGLVDRMALDHAPSTVTRMYSTLRALLSYAERSELIARSPARGIRLPKVPLVDRPVLAADQLDALADALGADAPMMWLGVVLGLRWREVAGLKVGRIDFLRRTVMVASQLSRDRRDLPPKSDAGRRTIAAPGWLMDELAAHLTRRGLVAGQVDAYVFVATTGAPHSYTSWRRAVWVPAVEAAGLPGLRFHDLRSNAATAMVAAGVDLKTA